ncbi:minor tail protein [Microbacterium phage ValentiniPuff]|uniref:Minor tail protein n=1 Tax=Microbacterium phage ValentiniPuff TaxID=2315705 RepID=A0A386KQW3_9CAUD|nr:minor tail protein [Microbacterium phage ValentiniPuff]
MTIHGKDTGIALAQYDLTRWCNEVSGDQSLEAADASCFDEPQGAKVYVIGLNDSTFSWSGREQGKINEPGLRAVVDGVAQLEAGVPFTVAVQRGFHPGRIAQMGSVLSTSINLSAPVADVVSVSGDFQSDGPQMLGRILTDKLPYTATKQGQAIDLAAPSLGAVIHVHITQNSRNGQVTVTVQHSDDGLVWVDLDQYIAEEEELASASLAVDAPVDQYVRAVVSLAGTSGTATVRVAIAVRK